MTLLQAAVLLALHLALVEWGNYVPQLQGSHEYIFARSTTPLCC